MATRRLLEASPWAALLYKNMLLAMILTAALSVLSVLVLHKHAQLRGSWKGAHGGTLELDAHGFRLDGRALRARYLPPLLFVRRDRHMEVCVLAGDRDSLWLAGYPRPLGLGYMRFQREGSRLRKR